MKTFSLFLGLVLMAGLGLQAQTMNAKLPEVKIQNLNGATVSTAEFDNDGKPYVVSFWATWCKPCIAELMTFHDDYPDLQADYGLKVIAVSIDDARNAPKVKSFINGRGWEFDVYLDQNSDFKRAMNVNNIPHTFLVNGNNEIVWQHNSYAPGDEVELYEMAEKLAEGSMESGHSTPAEEADVPDTNKNKTDGEQTEPAERADEPGQVQRPGNLGGETDSPNEATDSDSETEGTEEDPGTNGHDVPRFYSPGQEEAPAGEPADGRETPHNPNR